MFPVTPVFKLGIIALAIFLCLEGLGVPAVRAFSTHWPMFLPALIIVFGMAGVIGRGVGLQHIFHEDPELARLYGATHGMWIYLNSPAIFAQAAVAGSLIYVWGFAYALGFEDPGASGMAYPPGIGENWVHVGLGVLFCGILGLISGIARVTPEAVGPLQPGERWRSVLGFALGLGYGAAVAGLAMATEGWLARQLGSAERGAVAALAVPGLLTSIGFLYYPKILPVVALTALASAFNIAYALGSTLPEHVQPIAVAGVVVWLALCNGVIDRLRLGEARLKFQIPGILDDGGESHYALGRLKPLTEFYPPSVWTRDIARLRRDRRAEEKTATSTRRHDPGHDPEATFRQTDPSAAWDARPGRVAPLVALTAWAARTGRRATERPDRAGAAARSILGNEALGIALGQRDGNGALAQAAAADAAAGRSELPKLVILATSGGAYRASFWTGVVLDALGELERAGLLPGFTANVRLVTGASGGMVGGAYFAAMARPEGSPVPSICDAIEADILAVQGGRGPQGADYPHVTRFPIPRDSLSPIAQRMVQRDLPGLFWPAVSRTDRGTVLEDQWARLDLPFADLRAGEQEGWRPSLILSPMIAETGQPLLISNLDMDLVRRDAYFETIEFFNLFPAAQDSFRLKTAVRLNAAFPYIAPAAALPTLPYLRVVDAGYFDNYGIDLAATYLARPEIRDWILANTSGVVVLQLRAFPFPPPLPEPSGMVGRAMEWLTTPVEGVLSARGSTMTYRHRQSLRQVRLDYAERAYPNIPATERPDFIQSYMFEARSETSLNWYLPGRELEQIRGELRKEATQRTLGELVAGWWR